MLVMERRSSKQIARHLGISQTSVDTYVRRARQKLGVKDRYAAARLLEAWLDDEGQSNSPGDRSPEAPPAPADAARDRGIVLRLPPLETLNTLHRLGFIVGGAVIAAVVFGVILTAMAAL